MVTAIMAFMLAALMLAGMVAVMMTWVDLVASDSGWIFLKNFCSMPCWTAARTVTFGTLCIYGEMFIVLIRVTFNLFFKGLLPNIYYFYLMQFLFYIMGTLFTFETRRS